MHDTAKFDPGLIELDIRSIVRLTAENRGIDDHHRAGLAGEYESEPDRRAQIAHDQRQFRNRGQPVPAAGVDHRLDSAETRAWHASVAGHDVSLTENRHHQELERNHGRGRPLVAA